MATKTTTKKNSRIRKAENAGPYNYPLAGVFDMTAGGMRAASSAGAPSHVDELGNNLTYVLMTMLRMQLSYAYVQYGPIRTLVDQPVFDALRGGVDIQSDEVGPEDIEELQRTLKQIRYFQKLNSAVRWSRLFGGAGMIINIAEDYSTKLNIDRINEATKIDFKVADRWELVYQGIPSSEGTMFDYYGNKVHPSRVAKIMGQEAPSIVAMRLMYWGMSEIECVIRELNSYFKNHNVIFEFLDEAKTEIWKIKDFNSTILDAYAHGAIHKRLRYAQEMKNFLNAIAMDAEDDFVIKNQTFSGLAEILKQIQIGIAAACRMPMSKLFGLAASGFASGEDDIEVYNSIVEVVRDKTTEVMDATIPAICMKTWGFVPSDLSYEYKPLRVLTAEQQENVLNSRHQRNQDLYNAGIMDAQEFCEAEKQDGVLKIQTKVAKGAEPEPPHMGLLDEGGDPEKGDTEGGSPGKHGPKQPKKGQPKEG